MLNNKKNEIISNNNAFIYNYKIEYINIDVNELSNKNLIINEKTFNNIINEFNSILCVRS